MYVNFADMSIIFPNRISYLRQINKAQFTHRSLFTYMTY